MSSPPTWMIARDCEAYPACLGDLEPPERPVLHGAGRRSEAESLDHQSTVTIVGSRRASDYGLRVAEHLARELATAGVTVVSGLARGIDAAAHRGALAGGGTTVAVLANGPDVAYPPGNRALYERILETGAVLAEHPPGTRARKQDFPARNRIMAALASVVVIVEAAQPSGSLITADLALRLGRTVGAVPGQVGVRVAAGTNDLIKEGAHLIRDAGDVLELLYGVGVLAGPRGAEVRVRNLRPGPPVEATLEAVLDLIETGASSIDRVAIGAGIAPRDAALALAQLELLGYVAAGPLGEFSRTPLPRG